MKIPALPAAMTPLATLATLALLLCACRAEGGRDDGAVSEKEVPAGPERAAAAAARVLPALTRDLAEKGLEPGDPVFFRAFKEERELELWLQPEPGARFVLFRTYRIAAASGSLGPKLAEGDRQVPEGFYFVTPGRMNPASRFHLAFNIGYPNAYDRHHGRGGSLIMAHGDRVSIGCLAMTDAGIEEIYTLADAALESGQPFFRIHLFPFRMSGERMERARDERWFPFWRNLREGYDFFETHRQPPNVELEDGRYIFEPAAP